MEALGRRKQKEAPLENDHILVSGVEFIRLSLTNLREPAAKNTLGKGGVKAMLTNIGNWSWISPPPSHVGSKLA